MEFYRGLIPIEDFEQIQDLKFFKEVPTDWVVLLSDIKGSTKAVQQGRSKDVNMLGAAVITLVANGTKEYNTLSVFGGDGATLLLSEKDFLRLRPQLVGLMKLALEDFSLELRVGAVKVSTLNQLGHPILVGRYRISETTDLAQFAGSGISVAETMVKEKNPQAQILALEQASEPPDLGGLSCRMSRFSNKKGQILSLIVKGKTEAGSAWIRQMLVPELKKILDNDFKTANPIRRSDLHWRWLPETLGAEIKLQRSQSKSPLKVFLRALIANTMLRLNIAAGGFFPKKYKTEVPLQSDFKKFDDALRMVIDCSTEQSQAIQNCLQKAHQEEIIYYGIHQSENAVVTCLTLSASKGQHVHFVDGEGCGYTMASIQLKKQISGR